LSPGEFFESLGEGFDEGGIWGRVSQGWSFRWRNKLSPLGRYRARERLLRLSAECTGATIAITYADAILKSLG
jgi:hypothetical protein